MADLKVPEGSSTPGKTRNRSATVPDSFCFAQDFLDSAASQTLPPPRSGGLMVRKPPENSWERFLADCGVDPGIAPIVAAVKITVKRHLEKSGKTVTELPGGGLDMAALPADLLAETVSLVRKALVAFRESR